MQGPAGRGAYRILRRAEAAEFDSMDEDATKNQPSEKWRILDVLEFTSKRKRMSVIVKDAKGNIRVITKGADSKVFDNLNKKEKGGKMHLRTKAHAAGFANDGLRTLGVGQRMVGEAEFAKWKREMDALRLDPIEVKKKKAQEDNKIDDKAGELEIGLSLLGATAIEDKLQVGVPDAIADLARAGIKLWVLTGDKEDTAINIGFACKLLRDDMHCAIIRGEWGSLAELQAAQAAGTPGMLDGSTLSPEGDVAKTLADRVHTIKTEAELRHELVRAREAFPANQMKYIVVDGKALDVCLDGPVLRAKDKTNLSVKKAMDEPIYRELLKLSVLCDAVVCCRVSPLQKALMVSLVKDNSPGLKTLAIGDGANDVPMIQTAHIGVGIAGQEGMQAVRASDFAVGQFRFLRRLTLVHGRSNYRKGALMLCYMFYKNIVLCLAPYFYKAAYQTAEDGISRWIGVSFYNVIHTAWPILLVAFYDFDISPDNAERFPRLYHSGPAKRRFNVRVFLFWTFLAFLHSILIFAFAYYGSGSGCISWNLRDAPGGDDGNQVCQVGQTTYLGGHITTLLLCTVVTVKIASEFARIYWWTIMPFLAFSLISYPVMMLIYTTQITFNFGVDGDPEQQHKVAWLAFQFGTTWLSLLGCLAIVVMIDAAIKYVNRRFFTQFEHLVHEAEALGTCFAAGKQLGAADVKRAARSDSDPVLDRKEIALAHLDAIDEELWGLEKAGLLEIPGPKLPSFPEVEGANSSDGAAAPRPVSQIVSMTNPLEAAGKTRDRTASELEMGGRAGEKKSSGGDGGGRRVSRLSVASVNASAGGMSMDHHAAETVAGSLRRHISESEGVRRAST
jgi:phospholipid-translocating P-type ATPase (flippase)